LEDIAPAFKAGLSAALAAGFILLAPWISDSFLACAFFINCQTAQRFGIGATKQKDVSFVM